MRVLIISPYFPPRADSESFCGGKFAQALVDAGIETVAISSLNAAPTHPLDTSARWRTLATLTVDVPNQTPALTTRCRLGLRYQTTEWTGWTAAAVSKARALHRTKPFDALVSRSAPWYAHMAGYWIASSLRLPWLANLNDPWDQSPFADDEASRTGSRPSWNAGLWRRRVLQRADIITFPCERLRDYTFHDYRRRSGVHIIPHVGATSASPCGPERQFTIVHAGKLRSSGGGPRRANALIKALAELFEVRGTARSLTRLVFVGPEDPVLLEQASDLGVAKAVTWVGPVSYDESLEHIGKASVCVVVEAPLKEGIFLPSKFCDYITARKPVIAMSPADGTLNDVAQEGGVLRVAPDDPDEALTALTTLFDAFVQGSLSAYTPPRSLVSRYRADRVVEDFLTALREARAR